MDSKKKKKAQPEPEPTRTLDSDVARKMAKKRWKGVSEEDRHKFAMRLVSFGNGRPIDTTQKRCPCGAMTMKRAKTRADKNGKSLGHRRGCAFYRALPLLNRPAKKG